jgi:hypothetical protein
MPPVDVFHHRQLARLRLLPLPAPAAQLARHVVLLTPQLAQTDPVRVDGVDRHQGVDDSLTNGPPLGLLGEQLGLGLGAKNRPRDEVHHVERRAAHVLVLAEADNRRHGDVGPLKRGDHGVLAGHVVRRAEPLA